MESYFCPGLNIPQNHIPPALPLLPGQGVQAGVLDTPPASWGHLERQEGHSQQRPRIPWAPPASRGSRSREHPCSHGTTRVPRGCSGRRPQYGRPGPGPQTRAPWQLPCPSDHRSEAPGGGGGGSRPSSRRSKPEQHAAELSGEPRALLSGAQAHPGQCRQPCRSRGPRCHCAPVRTRTPRGHRASPGMSRAGRARTARGCRSASRAQPAGSPRAGRVPTLSHGLTGREGLVGSTPHWHGVGPPRVCQDRRRLRSRRGPSTGQPPTARSYFSTHFCCLPRGLSSASSPEEAKPRPPRNPTGTGALGT